MASGKPLTGFLLALSHSPELAKAFSDPEQRDAILAQWGLGTNELFKNGDPTLQEVQEEVAKEHKGNDQADGNEPPVVVTWWVWF